MPIYIYIYIGWVQVTFGVTLNNVTHLSVFWDVIYGISFRGIGEDKRYW